MKHEDFEDQFEFDSKSRHMCKVEVPGGWVVAFSGVNGNSCCFVPFPNSGTTILPPMDIPCEESKEDRDKAREEERKLNLELLNTLPPLDRKEFMDSWAIGKGRKPIKR
jgi:hypothetical protein